MAVYEAVGPTISQMELRKRRRRGDVVLEPGEQLPVAVVVGDGARLPAGEPAGPDDLRYQTCRAQERRQQDDALDRPGAGARMEQGAQASQRYADHPDARIA